MIQLTINLLGPLHVTIDQQTAEFRTDALRVLLTYLAAHQGVPQRRDTLAGLLSPDRPNKEALTYLRNRLVRLRQSIKDDTAVPPWFEIDRKQLTLRTGDDIQIDVTRFDALLDTVENHAHRQLAGCPTCLGHLQEAADLVRGEFLAGLNFASETWESWLLNQREHYQQRVLEAITLLTEAKLELGEWSAVLELAQRQLSFEPWRESAHRAMMQAHYHLGDRSAALAQFEACQQLLWDELGVEPEDETLELHEAIATDMVVPSILTDIPDNIPWQTGAFFGRESETELLLQRLVDPNHRLLTLVGAGGIGKTRLSQEIGRQVKRSFPDGVWFVSFHGVRGAEQIKIAVGEAAELSQTDKPLNGRQVLNVLRRKCMLLIFDNCEEVLDDLSFIPEWLKKAPDIAILATSREPLNLQAESVVHLAGLPVGDEGADHEVLSTAEAMFIERGKTARSDFDPTADTLPLVREICYLVGGSPLGIALAAAWVRRRSLLQIVESINQSLDFLTSRLRDIDPRHRNMRAVFETSWQLLMEEEQATLAALAVFPESFTAEAAEAVAEANLFDLDILCEKSLLQQQQEPERYLMHRLVRQFAADKLADRTLDTERAFITYFYRYAYNHQQNYEALRPEWHNFSAGIAKAREQQAWAAVLDFVQILDEPWFRQIRFEEMTEGLMFACEAAGRLGDELRLAELQLRLAEIKVELNDYGLAESYLNFALPQLMHFENDAGIANAKYLFGRIRFEQTQNDQALKLLEESKSIYADIADWQGVARNTSTIAHCYLGREAYFQTAHDLLEQSIATQRRYEPSVIYIESLRYLARSKHLLGDYQGAKRLLSEALELNESLHELGEYIATLYECVLVYRFNKEADRALHFAEECMKRSLQLGSIRWEALIKTQLCYLEYGRDNYDQALLYCHESLQLFAELEDIYEQAHSHFQLYVIYKTVGDLQQSIASKEEAMRLNAIAKDSRLEMLLM